MQINFNPVGIIHTPFVSGEGMPVQPPGAKGIKGTIIVNKELQGGLSDLEGFSHIILIYHFHRSKGFDLKVIPFMDNQPRGIFSTRAPKRPNPIGISVVKLLSIKENFLEIENTDILDGTPLLDIKPYIQAFDVYETQKCGWFDQTGKHPEKFLSDNRFL